MGMWGDSGRCPHQGRMRPWHSKGGIQGTMACFPGLLCLTWELCSRFFSLLLQVCVVAVVPYAPGTKGLLTTSSLRILRWVTSPAGIPSHHLTPSRALRAPVRGRQVPGPCHQTCSDKRRPWPGPQAAGRGCQGPEARGELAPSEARSAEALEFALACFWPLLPNRDVFLTHVSLGERALTLLMALFPRCLVQALPFLCFS